MTWTKLDPDTGYPFDYEPGWWECPKCKNRWHDAEQKGVSALNWSKPPPCNCEFPESVGMVRPADRTQPSVLGSCPHCEELILEGTLE